MSILPDDVSLKDGCCDKNIQHTQIEMLPPPPVSNTRKSPTVRPYTTFTLSIHLVIHCLIIKHRYLLKLMHHHTVMV